jgi:hypothetical protein
VFAVRRVVLGITAMKRMSTLVSLSTAAARELEENIRIYKEESEKENVDEARSLHFCHAFGYR